MALFQILGIISLIFLFTRFRHYEICKVEFPAISSFLSFMAVITVIRLCTHDFTDDQMASIYNYKSLLWVFLEDAAFVLPMIYVEILAKEWDLWEESKYIRFIGWICFSLWFGYGHLYQGFFAAALISLYPYFISRRFGIKHGILSVMLMHILYDFITVFTPNIQFWLR